MSTYSSADDVYDSDELPQLQINLIQLKERATTALRATCTGARRLTRGSIARVEGDRGKEESEIATISYLKEQTSFWVLKIHYENLDPEDDVGAAYVLVKRHPGVRLYKIRDYLSLVHGKVHALGVLFNRRAVDSIESPGPDGLKPVLSPCWESPKGPFRSTAESLNAFVSPAEAQSRELSRLYPQSRMKRVLSKNMKFLF